LPWLRDALAAAPFLVSFNSFPDETTALAHLVLPSHLALEEWGSDVPEPGPGSQVLSLQQPLVRPLQDTRSFWDVLLAVAEEIGGDAHAALPWSTFKDVVRDGVRPLTTGGDFEQAWTSLLQQGGVYASSAEPTPAWPAATFSAVPPAQFADGDYALVLFPHNSLGDGRSAHLPWLQA